MPIHIYKDEDAVSVAAANWIADLIQQKLQQQPTFSLLLSGGNTPKKLYHVLSTEEFRKKIDWTRMEIFFGDERIVPFEDDRNNGKMAYQSLLKYVNIPKEQVHYIETTIEPTNAAGEYEKLLKQHFRKGTSFDLALLGMGEDGHTLSVFPGSPLVQEAKKLVVSLYVPEQKMYRVTVMPAIVNRSAVTVFLVTGSSKAQTLQRVIEGKYYPDMYPAQLVQPVNKELYWFIDEAAAGSLHKK